MDETLRKRLLIVGGGALLAYLLFGRKAKAAELPSGTEATGEPKAGGSTSTTFTDPATGIDIEGPSTSLAPTVKYIVQRGEAWSNLASRVYGDYRFWPFLWDWNRIKFPSKYQSSPDILMVGDEIELPALPVIPSAGQYRDDIFRRAQLHRDYWLCKRRGGSCGSLDAAVLVSTPLV